MRDLKIIREMSKQRQNKLFFCLTKLMHTKRLSCLQVNLIQTEKERQHYGSLLSAILLKVFL